MNTSMSREDLDKLIDLLTFYGSVGVEQMADGSLKVIHPKDLGEVQKHG